jgi:hypothetical protein
MKVSMLTCSNSVVTGANQVDDASAATLISRAFGLDRRLLCEGGGSPAS